MTDAINLPSGSFRFVPWFGAIVREEMAAYPGRVVMVARMVIAATLTTILVMAFRVHGGYEGALYAFLISRDDMRSTWKSGIAVFVSYSIGVAFVLTGAALFGSHPDARFLWFAGSMFVVFFALDTLQDFAVATGFTIILVLALPIWQIPATAEYRVEFTLAQAFACLLGTVVTIAVEAAFHSLFPQRELFKGIDDRLSAVQSLIQQFASGQPIDGDIANRLTKYANVGVSGVRRTLARSGYEPQVRDQLSAVTALTGRLVDLGASSAHTPYQLLDTDRERLHKLADQIASLRVSLPESSVTGPSMDRTHGPSGVPLLGEMERTADLVFDVFSVPESLDVYIPSLLDQEESANGFFKNDAFENPAHVYYALRGCTAATLCYFTYEMLSWRGIATSVTTCALTALSNVGAARQKQFLRIAGAVAGGLVLGIGSQVFILPYIDTIMGFSLMFAVMTAIAAWFATTSQRLSYFGLQIANAYYLVAVSGFNFNPSLAIARDRVVGIMLGLFAMWLAFHMFEKTSAAEQMIVSFSAGLRAVGQLALLPAKDSPKATQKKIRALRTRIGNEFQRISAQADAVPFEFGTKRPGALEDRALIQRWQPQLQAIYLIQVALMQHRIFGAEQRLPQPVQAAQRKFNEACASLLFQMAEHIECQRMQISPHLDQPVRSLSRAVESVDSDNEGLFAAQGLLRLSVRTRDELLDLAQQIGRARLRSIDASSEYPSVTAS